MENSKIEWTDHTFNPWEGCTAVSTGCDHCYAEARNARFAGGSSVNWGPGAPRRRTSPANWRKPLAWDKAHAEFFAQHGRRQRVFCASLADVFDNEVPGQWRIDLMSLILETPNLDWLLLTKRIGNAQKMLETAFKAVHAGRESWANNVPPNVWIGSTVVNQAEADRDVPKLLAVPAARRFLSIEPMLGSISLDRIWGLPCSYCGNSDGEVGRCWCGLQTKSGIDWVICGGESGPNASPMHPDWARSLRDQCAAAGVPFLFKQWGEWVPRSSCYHTFSNGQSCADIDPSCKKWPMVVRLTDAGHDGARIENVNGGNDAYMQRVGNKTAGRLLDGRTHDDTP